MLTALSCFAPTITILNIFQMITSNNENWPCMHLQFECDIKPIAPSTQGVLVYD